MTRRLAALLAAVALSLSFNLAGYPLLDPDEGRNAEVAREMAERNSYLLPRLNGLPYVDKPVVFFAATALAFEVLGPGETAARLAPLLFTFATMALVWWWGGRLFGRDGGWIAAIVMGASPLTLGFARTVIMDSATTLFVTAALICFHESAGRGGGARARAHDQGPPAEPRGRRTAEWWSALAWISLALGVLTKGPIALGIPLMVVIPWLAWRRQWRPLLDPVGILLAVVIVLPWVRAVANAAPGYLHHVFVTETWLRLTTPALQRTGPWWYFVPVLPAAALPWSVVVVTAAYASLRRRGGAAARGGSADGRFLLLALWILVPLLFFSLSQSKRPQYVLPLVPAIALLLAGLWSRAAEPPNPRAALPGSRAAAGALALIGAFLLVAPGAFAEIIRGMTPAVAAAIPGTARLLGLGCLAGAGAGWLAGARLDLTLAGLALPVLLIPFVSPRLMREIGRDRSSRDLADAIGVVATPQTEVVGVQAYPLSLPFYTGRALTLATDDARELTSNYLPRTAGLWQRVPDTPLRPVSWWREAALECERPRVFVIRFADAEARAFLEPRLPLIAANRKYLAYGPCGKTDLARAG